MRLPTAKKKKRDEEGVTNTPLAVERERERQTKEKNVWRCCALCVCVCFELNTCECGASEKEEEEGGKLGKQRGCKRREKDVNVKAVEDDTLTHTLVEV